MGSIVQVRSIRSCCSASTASTRPAPDSTRRFASGSSAASWSAPEKRRLSRSADRARAEPGARRRGRILPRCWSRPREGGRVTRAFGELPPAGAARSTSGRRGVARSAPRHGGAPGRRRRHWLTPALTSTSSRSPTSPPSTARSAGRALSSRNDSLLTGAELDRGRAAGLPRTPGSPARRFTSQVWASRLTGRRGRGPGERSAWDAASLEARRHRGRRFARRSRSGGTGNRAVGSHYFGVRRRHAGRAGVGGGPGRAYCAGSSASRAWRSHDDLGRRVAVKASLTRVPGMPRGRGRWAGGSGTCCRSASTSRWRSASGPGDTGVGRGGSNPAELPAGACWDPRGAAGGRVLDLKRGAQGLIPGGVIPEGWARLLVKPPTHQSAFSAKPCSRSCREVRTSADPARALPRGQRCLFRPDGGGAGSVRVTKLITHRSISARYIVPIDGTLSDRPGVILGMVGRRAGARATTSRRSSIARPGSSGRRATARSTRS